MILSLIFIFFNFSSQAAFASINETLNIEGKLVNVDGTNATAACIAGNTCDFRLNIYDAQTAGTLLWQEVQPNISVSNGIFNLKAGSVTAIDNANLQQFNRNDLWFELQFDPTGTSTFTAPETFARTRFSSVPYAMNSKYVGGLANTSFLRSDTSSALSAGTLTLNAGTALNITDIPLGSVVFATTAGKLTSDSANLFWDDTNKRLGIGLADPDANLTVKDSMIIRRVGTVASLIFTNTAGTGDFRIAGDGNDIYWQGGGSRALQMGGYWETILGGNTGSVTPPAFQAGVGGKSVLVINSRATDVPLMVRGFAGQSVNLSEWQDSASVVLAAVTSTGVLSTTAGVNINTASTNVGLAMNYTSTGTTATGLLIANTSTGAITTAIDVSDPEIVNAINLGNNNILMDNSGEVNLNNIAGTNLMRIKDVAPLFGVALDAGAFIDRNSYIGEEFNKARNTLSADTTGSNGGGMGDGGGWGVAESTDCTFLTVADAINGIMRMVPNVASNGCLSMIARGVRAPSMNLNANNLPTIIMKVMPSVVSANNVLFVGMADSIDGAVVDPVNFIGFTNNGGTTWTGRTTRSAAPAGTQNVVCTGQTISTTQFALLKIETRSNTDVRFFVDNDVSDGISWVECGTGSQSSIPVVNLAAELQYQRRTAAGVVGYLNTDFFRVWQDDSPSTPVAAVITAQSVQPVAAEVLPGTDPLVTADTIIGSDMIASESIVPNSDVLGVTTQIPVEALTIDTFNTRLSLVESKMKDLLALISQAESIHVNNLNVNSALTVSGKSILNGGLFVNGASEFVGSTVFLEDVNIKGNITVTNDNAGYAVIKAGMQSVTILYDKPLAGKPVVTVSPSQNPDNYEIVDVVDTEILSSNDYYISASSKNSFTIKLKVATTDDVYFTWHSLSVDNPAIIGR